jgi:hypothetical protein
LHPVDENEAVGVARHRVAGRGIDMELDDVAIDRATISKVVLRREGSIEMIS